MNARLLALFVVAALILFACSTKPSAPEEAGAAKGELAFLLQYDGKLPEDVGLLRNQVVQRRLGIILKDSLQPFLKNTQYGAPITVSAQQQQLFAQFFSDSDRSVPSAELTIDVEQDAIWVEYLAGDSIVEYTDHPSIKRPGLKED